MNRRLLEFVWAARRRLASTSAPASASGLDERPSAAPEWATTRRAGDEEIGYGYLERWRRSERQLVTPIGTGGTSIRLFSHNAPDTPPATHPHVLVEARNLIMDFRRIGRRDEVAHRPGYQRVRGGYLDYERGALLAAGTAAPDLGPDLFPRDHLRDIFQSLETSSEPPTVDRTIQETCLFVTREPREYQNLFHAHTDWLAAFMTVRLLGLEGAVKRVVLLDPHAPGSLDGGWARLFASSEAVRRRGDFGSERIRFEHAVFVPPGYSSILWARQQASSAGPPVGLLQDYGRFFRSAFCPSSGAATGAPIRVVLLARRPYPGRGPVMLRQFRSDAALVAALRSSAGLSVDIVDPATLSLRDQVVVAARSEILVGAHGAGLAHAFAMADYGAVAEIVAAPSSSTYRLYANLAGWTDRAYARIEAPERLGWSGTFLDPNPAELADCVSRLALRVRERRAANSERSEGG